MLFGLLGLLGLAKESIGESQCQRYLREEDRKIAAMDIWDGIAYQLASQFYPGKYDWWSGGARWGGDNNKPLNISMHTVNVNKQFWDSGLTLEEFMKKYTIELLKEHPRDDYFWDSDFTKDLRNPTIYLNYNERYRLYPHHFWQDSVNWGKQGKLNVLYFDDKKESAFREELQRKPNTSA